MKIFQIENGVCVFDMTFLYANAEQARNFYPHTVQIEDTPDYVFEGWGFDHDRIDEHRFLKPIPPAGFLYDEQYGSFYAIGELPPSEEVSQVERIQELEHGGMQLKADIDFIAIMSGVTL